MFSLWIRDTGIGTVIVIFFNRRFELNLLDKFSVQFDLVLYWQWATICLRLPHSTLKTVIAGLLAELKRLQLKVPALPVASAISDRLSCLMNNGSNQTELSGSIVERALMYSELARRETFTKWPHGNYKYVLLHLLPVYNMHLHWIYSAVCCGVIVHCKFFADVVDEHVVNSLCVQLF